MQLEEDIHKISESTEIKKISDISKNETKEIFSDVIRSSEFYDQQI